MSYNDMIYVPLAWIQTLTLDRALRGLLHTIIGLCMPLTFFPHGCRCTYIYRNQRKLDRMVAWHAAAYFLLSFGSMMRSGCAQRMILHRNVFVLLRIHST